MTRSWGATIPTLLAGSEISRCYLCSMNNGPTTVRMTSHDTDLVVGGFTYLKTPGFSLSRYTLRNGGAPATLDVDIPFSDDGPIYSDDVRHGGWRGATFTAWIADVGSSPISTEILMDGYVGLTAFSDRLSGTMELVTLADKLKDVVLFRIQPKCSFRFGDRFCGVDETVWRQSAVVTAVTSRKKFTSPETPPSGKTFIHGKVTWLTGDNANREGWIRTWDVSTGLFELVTEFPFEIQISDTFYALPGCPKTRVACDSFDNIDRFPGFDFVADR